MLDNKIKCILALFIILVLSMNAFSATDFTDDSSDSTLESSSVDEVVADGVATDGDSNVASDGDSNSASDGDSNSASDGADDQTEENKNTEGTTTGTESTGGNGTQTGTQMPSFGNMTFGNKTFGGNGTGMNFNFSGMNFSNMSMDDFMDMIKKYMGGNETNNTNGTTEVTDVPEVVSSSNYAPVAQSAENTAQHFIQRLRDNVIVSTGDALRLEGINSLFDSDFRNGHLLVYVDGKLVFNEITSGDLSTPIFWITDDYLGQHQISVEFTPNGTSNTNKYTEDVYIG